MPFDIQGARAAGYSDGEIASFLGDQAGFDTGAALKSGYKPEEIIPFLSQRLNAPQEVDRGPADDSDPLTRVSASTPGTGASTFTASATPDAGGGRGAVNPPLIGQPQPGDEDNVGILKSAALGYGKAGASTAKTVNLAVAAPAVVLEKIKNGLTGSNDTSAQDYVFSRLVDPMDEAVNWYSLKPGEKQGFLSKVAEGIGALAQDLPLMIASGGAATEQKLAQSFPTVGRFLEDAVGQGFTAMRPLMVKSGVEKAQQVLDAGGSVEDAVKSATTAAIATGFTGSQPMSAQGKVIERILTGIPVGAVTSEAHRVIQNAADPEAIQQPFSVEGLAVGAVTNAAMAGAMGHASTGKAPDRIDLGYDPMTGRTATAQGIRDAFGPSDAAREPVRAELAPRDPVESVRPVLEAGSVDEAIAAAKVAANPESSGTIREQMLALRPLPERLPDVRPETAVPAEAAGADRGGLPDAGAGLGDRLGSAGEPERPVAGRPAADGVEGGPVSPGDGAAEAVAPRPAAEVEAQAAAISVRRNDSGTATVIGEPAAVADVLRAHKIPFVPSAEGALVGRTHADAAQRVVEDFAAPKVPVAESSAKIDNLPAARTTDDRNTDDGRGVRGTEPAVLGQFRGTEHAAGREMGDGGVGLHGADRAANGAGDSQGTADSGLDRAGERDNGRRGSGVFGGNDRGEALASEVALKRGEPTRGITPDAVRQHLAEPLSKLVIPHVIHPTVQAAREAAGVDIPEGAKGMHYQGKIHLFAESLRTPLEAEQVFWHEVQHAGLRETTGRGRDYENTLREIALKNRNVRDAAKVWMRKYGEEDYEARVKSGMSPERAMLRTKLQAIDEALAELSGRNAQINGVAKLIAKAQEIMRSLGLHKLANALEGKTDAEALALILRSRNAVMGEAKGRSAGEMAPAFSKDRAALMRGHEFVQAPDGRIDFGEITQDMGRAMKRQAGTIRLPAGEHHADGTGYGLAHIEANHGRQIRNAGFESASAFVAHVAGSFNEVLQAAKGRQLLVAVTDGRQDVMFVQLEAASDGDYYRVNTAFPASRNYLEKQEDKGAKVLWSGSEPRTTATGQQTPYAGKPETRSGQAAPIARDNGIVAPGDGNGQYSREPRTVQVDGKRYPAENANGQPVHPTFEGQKRFWKWAGDNAVMKDGKPIVLYHGTPNGDIEQFKNERGAIYFTDSAKMAEGYTLQRGMWRTRTDGAAIYPVYLSMKNPLVIDALGKRNDNIPVPWQQWKPKVFGNLPEGAVSVQDAVEYAKAHGHDGLIVKNVVDTAHVTDKDKSNVYAVFDANQVKSAIGNSGDFSPSDDRVQFSRADIADEAAPERKPRAIPGAKAIAKAGEMYDSIKREILMPIAPMSAGSSTEARAAAQNFANETRLATQRWQYLHDFIEKTFTPAERERMWNAADEENAERTRMRDEEGYQRPEGVGLDSLSPKEREAVQTLHDYADSLWSQAKAEGMIDGEGLPFWTPRMVVTVGEDGDVGKLRAQASGPKVVVEAGQNLKTTASSLKHRKYETTEETEAAASALAQKQGEAGARVVRDIMTMPLAMSRMERAIAGRRLVNQIKEIGRATGEDLIREDGRDPNYVMISHPALMTFSPKFTEVDGKFVAAADQNGDVIFEGKPLYIRKDFEGPLRAVLSTKDGSIYSGYMLLKSKSMSAIMFSPLIHNMVIWGKALPYSPLKMFTFALYAKGHAAARDPQVMEQALRDGVVPLGANRHNMVDVTDIAQPLEKMGKWGDPNESWVSLSAQKLGNALHEGWGDGTKKGLDAAGEFVHHTLLWKQVGALQMGIYSDAKAHYIAKGFSPEAAGIQAAHLANRYGGVVAKENQGEIARKAANVLLFSRSFNLTNWGTIKDAFTGMPTGLRSLIEQRAGKAEGDRAAWAMRRKAWSVLALDLGFGLIAASLVQDWVNASKKDKTLSESARGYVDRLASAFQNIKERPGEAESWNPWQLSSTYTNEPGKKTRINMGEGPTGRGEYMRLPTGKVIEDLIGWAFHPGETGWNKMAPLPKAAWESIVAGKDSIGVPVTDPNGSMLKRIGEGAAHVVKAQVPWDTMKSLYDTTQGYGTDLDKKKLAGNVTGFSFSQGHPNGPEGAVNQITQDRFEASRRYTMQQVKDDLKHGDIDKAVERMEAIGMTGREINQAIQRVESPRIGLSKKARQNFEHRASDAERREMEQQR